MALTRLTKITGPGVSTDTNWVGNNANFTGVTTTSTSFNIGVTTIHSTLAEVHNIKSTGIITATGAHFSGNVSIAGTLTYEDVTNIDSVGIITAPAVDVDDFLDVGSNIKLGNAGVITATSFVGSGAALTGIDATAIKDSGGNVKIQAQASGAIHSGVSTFQDIDVDGHTNLDNVSIAGVSTFAGDIYANSGTIQRASTGNKLIFNSSTETRFDHSSGSKVLLTFHNSGGFQGSLDVHAGAIVLNNGGNKTSAVFRNQGAVELYYDNAGTATKRFQTKNTGAEVFGELDVTGDLDVDGHTNLDNVSIAGITTFSGQGIRIENATNPFIHLKDTTNNTDSYVSTDDGGSLYLKADDNQEGSSSKIVFQVDGSEKIHIESGSGLKFTGKGTSIPVGGILHHTNNYLYVRGGTSGLILGNQDNTNTIHISESNFIKFETTDGSERLRIGSAGQIGIAGANYGSSGQVLTSGGASGAVSWSTVSGTTINNNANNRVITGSGTANTLEGESTLTYNGSGTLEISDSGSSVTITGAGVTKHEIGASASDNDLVIQNNKNAGNVTSNIIFKGSGASGGTVSEKLRINSSGHTLPGANLTYNLGASSTRWANIYGGYLNCFVNQASTYQVGEFRNEHSTYGGGVRFKSNNTYGSVEIMRYDGSYGAGFYNSTGGWHWDSNMQFHGSVTPWTNGNLNLGSSSKRWANVYTTDLQLSNEGKTNDVDGTWGDWTLQEGENDVFMINNRTGKKFAITMREVS